MLKHLYIRNFALIKELDIDFLSGFSVITGEIFTQEKEQPKRKTKHTTFSLPLMLHKTRNGRK